MKITASSDLSNIKTFEDLTRFATIALKDVVDVVNGGLNFTDNFRVATVSAVFTGANTEQAFNHALGKTPTGFLQIGANAAMIVYDGTSSNTSSIIYLRSSAVGTATLYVF